MTGLNAEAIENRYLQIRRLDDCDFALHWLHRHDTHLSSIPNPAKWITRQRGWFSYERGNVLYDQDTDAAADAYEEAIYHWISGMPRNTEHKIPQIIQLSRDIALTALRRSVLLDPGETEVVSNVFLTADYLSELGLETYDRLSSAKVHKKTELVKDLRGVGTELLIANVVLQSVCYDNEAFYIPWPSTPREDRPKRGVRRHDAIIGIDRLNKWDLWVGKFPNNSATPDKTWKIQAKTSFNDKHDQLYADDIEMIYGDAHLHAGSDREMHGLARLVYLQQQAGKPVKSVLKAGRNILDQLEGK